MKRMPRALLGGLLLLAVFAVPAAADDSSDVTIVNDSDWELMELYMSPSGMDEWGPDQLGGNTIPSGGRFTLTGIPCETYDLQVIDEEDDACVIEEVDLCDNNAVWHLTNEELLTCQKETDDE